MAALHNGTRPLSNVNNTKLIHKTTHSLKGLKELNAKSQIFFMINMCNASYINCK